MNSQAATCWGCQSMKAVCSIKVDAARVLTAALAVTFTSGAANAQDAATASFPNKPIRIIITFAAGGPTDGIARTLALDLSASLGQSVIVQNRSGANGPIGTVAAAPATADGYTQLWQLLQDLMQAAKATPEVFQRFLEKDAERWQRVLKQAGVKPESFDNGHDPQKYQ